MKRNRILVVDDNPQSVRLVEMMLGTSEFDVWAVQDAETALRFVDKVRPELILIDIHLPGIDGLQLAQRLRKMPISSKLPIVAVTAYTTASDRGQALAAGCTDYLSKPIDAHTFPVKIRSILQGGAGTQDTGPKSPSSTSQKARQEFRNLLNGELTRLESTDGESLRSVETHFRIKQLSVTAGFLRWQEMVQAINELERLASNSGNISQFLDQIRRCREAVAENQSRQGGEENAEAPGSNRSLTEFPGAAQLKAEYIQRLQTGLRNLAAAVSSRDFKQIRTFGHNLAGTGDPYGFPAIAECGRKLERQALANDLTGIGSTLSELEASMSPYGPN